MALFCLESGSKLEKIRRRDLNQVRSESFWANTLSKRYGNLGEGILFLVYMDVEAAKLR